MKGILEEKKPKQKEKNELYNIAFPLMYITYQNIYCYKNIKYIKIYNILSYKTCLMYNKI